MQGLKFRGRPPIKLADSVLDVVHFNDPYAAIILDRGLQIDEDFVDAIVGQSILTWEGRNPSPALDEDGNFVGTDLDITSFLFPLSVREAVIEFPFYKAHRPSITRSTERRINTPVRFGKMVSMTSNQEFFSVSARILDQSVIIRNPKTGEKVDVPAKKIPFFKPSKELKDFVNTSATAAQSEAAPS